MNYYKGKQKDELEKIEWGITDIQNQILEISSDINQKLLQVKNDESADNILIDVGRLATNRQYLRNILDKYKKEKSVKEAEIFEVSNIKLSKEYLNDSEENSPIDIFEDIFE